MIFFQLVTSALTYGTLRVSNNIYNKDSGCCLPEARPSVAVFSRPTCRCKLSFSTVPRRTYDSARLRNNAGSGLPLPSPWGTRAHQASLEAHHRFRNISRETKTRGSRGRHPLSVRSFRPPPQFAATSHVRCVPSSPFCLIPSDWALDL
jgi:hypothetical protein